jgi:sugar phosphate isomerase/epimerase
MQSFAFTKLFQPAPAAKAFKQIKDMGFDGLDLTVRKGGYVDPDSDHYEQDWVTCQAAWEAAGIIPGMLTTELLSPQTPFAREIITSAEKFGVKYIKLGYASVKFGQVREDLDTWRKGILELVPLAEDHGVTLMIHVHSANYSGAVPFHWIPLFEKVKSNALAMYLDPCHMHIEGGLQGWLMALEMAKDVTAVVAVKDYRWFVPYKRWEEGYLYPLFTALEHGYTPWNQVICALKRFGFDGPFSFHGEYSDKDRHDVPAAMLRDLKYFRNLWDGYEDSGLRLNKEKLIYED